MKKKALSLIIALYMIPALLSFIPVSTERPRAALSDFQYLGSFKTPFGRYGTCQIAFNPNGDGGRGSLFLTDGGTDTLTIGEIDIPALIQVTGREDLGLLHTAHVLQNPSDIYSRIPIKAATWPPGPVNSYNAGNFAAFGGLIYQNGKLFFNAYTYYDGTAAETATTGRIENPGDLAGSAVTGMFHNAGAAHTSGWMAVIPPEWQLRLGGTHLTGHDNGPPGVWRLSAGPSLFVFNLADTAAAASGASIPTIPRLDYPDVSGPRSIWNDDMANLSKTNKVWTLMTSAGFGMIVPGTRTYALFGTAGGFNANPANPWHGTPDPAFSPPYSGTIIYKRTDSLGYTYGGPGVWDAQDRHAMYAFFDLEEVLSAANPWEPRPYENGIFPAPFARYGNYTAPGQLADTIRGGCWDPASGRIYLTLAAAVNDDDPEYPGNPVVAVYELRTPTSDLTISGTVTFGGAGLNGVVLIGLPGNPATNASGAYTAAVPNGWSGTATPTLAGYTFTPVSRNYTNITANQTAQDYTAAAVVTAPPTPASISYPTSSATGSYTVSWAASTGATSYGLQRSTDGGTTWTTIYTGASTSYAQSLGNGSYRYRVRASNSAGDSTFRAGTWDCVVNLAPTQIGLNRTQLNFGSVISGPKTDNQSIVVSNLGGGTLNWTAAGGAGWLGVTPTSGTGTGQITVSVNPAGLAAGTYTSQVTFTAAGATNSPQTVAVRYRVYAAGSAVMPIGAFDTPAAGATVYGAIPVTGWALDDIQVNRVEIKRSPHPTDPAGSIDADGQVFISNAIFVEGARPDVETVYPLYSLQYRAGWGYMLLTNMLPNQGNWTFTLYAYAYDKEGKRRNLGQKTVTGNNAGSAKPFGAIDTPGQGEQISGAAFNQFGWALTPLPNTIPFDGSTIGVWVDGVNLGHPAYNYARSALAALFPGLNNTGGPAGLYVLNTTAYANGVHTIAWSAVDNFGNAEGIGSRYFSILNAGGVEIEGTGSIGTQTPGSQDGLKNDRHQGPRRLEVTLGRSALDGIATHMTLPIYVTKGYAMTARPDILYPDLTGTIDIEIAEVERIELLFGVEAMERAVRSGRFFGRSAVSLPHVSTDEQPDESTDRGFSPGTLSGYLLVGHELRPLPIGSTLDQASWAFAWQPGPGFLGEYTFVFVQEHSEGLRDKTFARITIRPKF